MFKKNYNSVKKLSPLTMNMRHFSKLISVKKKMHKLYQDFNTKLISSPPAALSEKHYKYFPPGENIHSNSIDVFTSSLDSNIL